MDARSLGFLLVALGVGVAVVGVLVATGALSWFGRLPGDIRIESDNVRVYIPVTSMILLSIVATIVLSLLRR